MNFDNIKPYIRHVEQVYARNKAVQDKTVIAYDNCILYMRSGNLSIIIDENEYFMSKGSVLIWRPGMQYCISNMSHNTSYIMAHFDYTYKRRATNCFRMMPEPPGIFNPQKISDLTVFENAPAFNKVAQFDNLINLDEMFVGLYFEFRKSTMHLDIRLTSRMILILTELKINSPKKDSDFVGQKTEDILKYIHNHYTEAISNKDIAARFGFHPQYVNRLVRERTGYSLHKYIIMRRIAKACELLATTKNAASDIGCSVGFQNTNHFSRYFKEFMNMSPGEFRKINGKYHSEKFYD